MRNRTAGIAVAAPRGERLMRKRERSRTPSFKSILSAVDFSLQSYAALQKAVQIARRSGGRLTALCVEDALISAGAAASGYDGALLRKSTLAQLERLMERMAKPSHLNRDAWKVETLLGKPAPTIVAFARKISADLIVMGTNGRTGPAKLFFGSVADSVLRHAPAPLLVVARGKPRQVDQERTLGPGDWRHRARRIRSVRRTQDGASIGNDRRSVDACARGLSGDWGASTLRRPQRLLPA